MNCRPPHEDADFFDDGGDSLSATEFLTRLEREMAVTLPPNLLFDAPRFGQLAARLEATGGDAASVGPEPAFLRFVRARIAGWQGEPVGPRRVIIARNTYRTATKVFFCGSGIMLADRFERKILTEHPIYLMRSLHGMGRHRYRHADALADIYADEIAAVLARDEPFILAGYCAGAMLMERVAERLVARGLVPRHFIAFDAMLRGPTAYPVFYIWSDDPNYSSVSRFADPARGFALRHPEGADFVHCRTKHLALLAGPKSAKPVRKAMAPILAGTVAKKIPPREPMSLDERKARYHARIVARVPRVIPVDGTLALTVRVTNTSGVTWPETEASGLYPAMEFLPLRGSKSFMARQRIGVLSSPVEPGDTCVFDCTLSWPLPGRRKPLFLQLTMVDDGIAAFDEEGSAGLKRLVFPKLL